MREKRDKLAKLVQSLEQNESKIRNMEQEFAALEQSCFQTAVSRLIFVFFQISKTNFKFQNVPEFVQQLAQPSPEGKGVTEIGR